MREKLGKYLQKSTNILDIGCYDGHQIIHWADMYPEKKFTGVDIEPAIIENAKKTSNLPTNIQFYCGNFLKEDSFLKKYDLIISHDTFILFSPDLKSKAIGIMLSHLNENGTIIINDFNYKVLISNTFVSILRRYSKRTWFWFKHCIRYFFHSFSAQRRAYNTYWFAGKKWYLSLSEPYAVKVEYIKNKGLFQSERTVPWFQNIANKIFHFRDLIIISKEL